MQSLKKWKQGVATQLNSEKQRMLGGNLQNFLGKFIIFFCNFKVLYGAVIHRKWVLNNLYSSQHHPLMISASKSTFNNYNLKILKPKVTKT